MCTMRMPNPSVCFAGLIGQAAPSGCLEFIFHAARNSSAHDATNVGISAILRTRSAGRMPCSSDTRCRGRQDDWCVVLQVAGPSVADRFMSQYKKTIQLLSKALAAIMASRLRHEATVTRNSWNYVWHAGYRVGALGPAAGNEGTRDCYHMLRWRRVHRRKQDTT